MTLSSNQFQETFTISGSSTNSLDLPFKFFADAEIKVTVNGSAFTAFSLEGAGRDSGVRRLTRTSGNFADADSVVVTRIVDGLQDFDPSTGQVLDVEGIEDAIDKATGFAQQALRIDTTNGQTYDAAIDGTAAKIVNVATGVANNDAVNKAQLDAAVAGATAGGGASVTIPTPDSGGADDDKILAVANDAYALKTPTQIRDDISLGTSNNVTHNNITAGGTITVAGAADLNSTMNVQGDATFQADVNVGDDLQLPAAGHIKAASGGVGVNVDCNSAGGTIHVRDSGTASSFPSGTNVIVAESSDADFTGLTVMGPNRANGQDHDIRFAAADSVGLTTGIRSTRGAAQANDTLNFYVNALPVVSLSSTGSNGKMDLSGGGTANTFISGVQTPILDTDAATKGYVDTQIANIGSQTKVHFNYQDLTVTDAGVKYSSLTPLASASGSYSGITGGSVDATGKKFTLPAGTYSVQLAVAHKNTNGLSPNRGPVAFLTTSLHTDASSLSNQVVSEGGTVKVESLDSINTSNGATAFHNEQALLFNEVVSVASGTQDFFVTVGFGHGGTGGNTFSTIKFYGHLLISKIA